MLSYHFSCHIILCNITLHRAITWPIFTQILTIDTRMGEIWGFFCELMHVSLWSLKCCIQYPAILGRVRTAPDCISCCVISYESQQSWSDNYSVILLSVYLPYIFTTPTSARGGDVWGVFRELSDWSYSCICQNPSMIYMLYQLCKSIFSLMMVWRLNRQAINRLGINQLCHARSEIKCFSHLILCEWNPSFTGGFPSQSVDNAELWCFMCC